MDKYLLEILKQVSTIIIPGLGALTITNTNTGEIMFMPYLKHDDGKLSAHIAEKEGWNENEAKNLIAKYVREIQAELDKGEDYTMYQFGSFIKVDGDIEFKNWKISTEKVENEFIPPTKKPVADKKPTKDNPKVVKLKEDDNNKAEKKPSEKKAKPIIPLVKEEVEDTSKPPVKKLNILEKEEKKATIDKLSSLKEKQKSKKTNQPRKQTRKKKGVGFWIGVGLLAILLSGGTYVGLNYDQIKQHIPFLADNSEEDVQQDKDIIAPEEDVNEDFSSEEKHRGEDIVEEDLVEGKKILSEEEAEEVTDDIIEELVLDPIIEPSVNSSELPYQIIAGAFSNEANASRLVEKLKTEGFPSIQKRKGSRYMVSVKSFATRADAQSELANIKETVPAGWITKW
tara:strand:- start:13524 stop:14717 length:1194 start_codon:yes stop_codon:yes gene_type:complete